MSGYEFFCPCQVFSPASLSIKLISISQHSAASALVCHRSWLLFFQMRSTGISKNPLSPTLKKYLFAVCYNLFSNGFMFIEVYFIATNKNILL
jgi:hypothetical protein